MRPGFPAVSLRRIWEKFFLQEMNMLLATILIPGRCNLSIFYGSPTSDILVLKFILVLGFINSHFYFYIITVLSSISISVFISFASNHFYIYFIIVLPDTIIYVCMSFLCNNIESNKKLI